MFVNKEARMDLLCLRSVLFTVANREEERKFSDFEFYFTRPVFLDIQATPVLFAKHKLLQRIDLPSWVRATTLTHLDPDFGSEMEFRYDDTDPSFTVDAMNAFVLLFFESIQVRELPLEIIAGIETRYPEQPVAID